MDNTTMITDMSRKIFGAEPQVSATSMPGLATRSSVHTMLSFWTGYLTAHSNKLHSRQLAKISWKGEFAACVATAQLKHYRQNILGIFRDAPVGFSAGNQNVAYLRQWSIGNGGNGQIMLGICWEFWRNMQMRFTGTKCLIRYWEYFQV